MSDTSSGGTRHHVVSTAAIEDAERAITEIQGREIAVFYVDGEYYAVANYCVHQGGPVCEGLLSGTVDVTDTEQLTYDRENEIVACPWHGWEFDITTGKHLARSDYSLPTYKTEVEDGELYVVL